MEIYSNSYHNNKMSLPVVMETEREMDWGMGIWRGMETGMGRGMGRDKGKGMGQDTDLDMGLVLGLVKQVSGTALAGTDMDAGL